MFHACVIYVMCDIFYTKYYLGKPQKKKSFARHKYVWWNYIDIGLKGMRYERLLTGSNWMILISCCLCDAAVQVCLTDSSNVLMSREIVIL